MLMSKNVNNNVPMSPSINATPGSPKVIMQSINRHVFSAVIMKVVFKLIYLKKLYPLNFKKYENCFAVSRKQYIYNKVY